MFYYFIRKLLFLIDPEKAHTLIFKYLNSQTIQLIQDFFLHIKFYQKKLHVWD